MVQQVINIGAAANDRTGDTWRDAMDKSNENFTELFEFDASQKTIQVAQESDFPVQDATTITLESGRLYFVTGSFTVAKRFVCENGASLNSSNELGVVLTYSGTGSMFTGVDVNFLISGLSLKATGGAALFNFSDVALLNAHVFIFRNGGVQQAAKFGTFTSMASIVIADVGATSVDDGLTIIGAGWRVWRFQNFGQLSASAAFIGFDLGVATCNLMTFNTLLLSAPAGGIGISGAAASANVIVGNLATVVGCNFLGVITPLSGIAAGDIRWFFNLNNAIKDTMPDAMVSLNNNAAETVIATQSIPVKVNGTFTIERDTQFTADTTGRITYDGERDITSPIDIVTTVTSASGTNKDVKVYLALNGAFIANSGKIGRVGATDPRLVSSIWQLTLEPGDFLEIFIENNSDTINLVVVDAVLRVL